MPTRLTLFSLVASLVFASLQAVAADIRVADEQLFARLDADGDGRLAAEDLPEGQSRLFARLLRLGDGNHDGQLTEQEWQRAIKPRRPAKPMEEKRSSELPGADATRLVLLKLDVDQDGVLTKDEATKELRSVFNQIAGQYDRNDDDRITRFELARGGPRLTRMAQQSVRRLGLDVNRELKEFDRKQEEAAQRFSEQPKRGQMLSDSKQALALFQEFDRNQDGKVERDELPEQAQGQVSRLFRVGDRNRDNALSEREFVAVSARAGRFLQRISTSKN